MSLTSGCSHIAVVTADLDRFVAFYREVFDAEVTLEMDEGDLRHALIDLGRGFALHPFELREGSPHAAGSPTVFDRGHLDHFAIDVDSADTFERLRTRLVAAGASDGTLTDFGRLRSVWFTDPDGMGCEITMWGTEDPRPFSDRRTEPYAGAAS